MVSIPVIRDETSFVSWATMAIFAVLVLDVGYEMGEYLRALKESSLNNGNNHNHNNNKEGRRAIRNAGLQTILFFLLLMAVSAWSIKTLTRGIDSRMTLILEGLSRLEAAGFFFIMSARTPQWIGVYFSPKVEHKRVQQVKQGVGALKFHVRWSVGIYLVTGYVLLLPYCAGRIVSAILGTLLGFAISGIVYLARRRPAGEDRWIALALAVLLGICSAILFANGCSYVQRVWATGPWRNEWGLRLVSFGAWIFLLLLDHIILWRQTERKMVAQRRFSTHARKERMAVSLIVSALRFPNKSGPIFSSLDKIQEEEDDDDDDEAEEETSSKQSTTTWSLIKRRLSTSTEELEVIERAHWAFWILVCFLSLFIVIVNVGATSQMDRVRQNFHDVHETIYGHMEQGPVCAFDRVGGTLQTFESDQAARAANLKIAHCGACSHCSDWHNLRLQYTTRNYLAKESARCGRKSLWGGRDAVRTCLNQEPIGFQGKCADCWTEDIFCARANCAFIFLQSLLINTMGNFAVGPDVITSATCEEAMCEMEFVPCSGANRRRMSIVSTIQRPGTQLCNIVEADWDEIFGEDGEFYSTQSQGVTDQSKEEL